MRSSLTWTEKSGNRESEKAETGDKRRTASAAAAPWRDKSAAAALWRDKPCSGRNKPKPNGQAMARLRIFAAVKLSPGESNLVKPLNCGNPTELR
jgi:hypothetical protein